MYKHETEDVEVICSISHFWKIVSWIHCIHLKIWVDISRFLNIITVVKLFKHLVLFCTVMFGKVSSLRPIERENLIDRRYKTVQNVVVISFIVSFAVLAVVIDFVSFVSIQYNMYFGGLEERIGYCGVSHFQCLMHSVYCLALILYIISDSFRMPSVVDLYTFSIKGTNKTGVML